MSVSTFSKFLRASGKPTCSCHIFYTNRRFPVCGYRHLAEKIWVVEGDNTIIYLAQWFLGLSKKTSQLSVIWPLIWPILDTYTLYIERFNNKQLSHLCSKLNRGCPGRHLGCLPNAVWILGFSVITSTIIYSHVIMNDPIENVIINTQWAIIR
jgi:hypothetical protein